MLSIPMSKAAIEQKLIVLNDPDTDWLKPLEEDKLCHMTTMTLHLLTVGVHLDNGSHTRPAG
jgi:hypothetical protein